MKVEKIIKKHTIEYEELMMRYEKSDIEDMITRDVEDKGYLVDRIEFKTDWKYVSDEWGMNSSPVSSFHGIEVYVTERSEIEWNISQMQS